MTFQDYYLKFADEAEADSILYTEVPVEWDRTDPDDPIPTKWEREQNYRNTDILPKVVLTPATFDDEGNELTPPVYEEGGVQIGAYLVQYDNTDTKPSRDDLLFNPGGAAEIMPLSREAIAKRIARR